MHQSLCSIYKFSIVSIRYHLRIIFDHCHCQNIHSQTHCFKKNVWGGSWDTIWPNCVWRHIFLIWSFPYCTSPIKPSWSEERSEAVRFPNPLPTFMAVGEADQGGGGAASPKAVKRGKRGGDRCVLPPATSAPSPPKCWLHNWVLCICAVCICVFVYLCIYIFVYLCCGYFELVHPPPPNCKSCTIAVTVSIRARCHNYTNNVPSRYLSSILTKSVSERVRRGQVRYRHSIVVDVFEVRFSNWLESHS